MSAAYIQSPSLPLCRLTRGLWPPCLPDLKLCDILRHNGGDVKGQSVKQ